MGPKSNSRCPYKRERRREDVDREKRRGPREDGGRDQNDAAASQRMLGPPEAGQGKEQILP